MAYHSRFLLVKLIAYFTFCNPLFAQELVCKVQDRALCEARLKPTFQDSIKVLPLGEAIVGAGKSLLGTEYVAHTLEVKDEPLVINLIGLDCTTFLENAIVLTRLAKANRSSFEDFQEELELLRYRNGQRDGYPSRLHYFTDWLVDNEKKGIVENLTEQCGGIPYEKNIDFMSTNREKYQFLKTDDQAVAAIGEVEKTLNQHNHFFIPKAKVQEAEGCIQEGDLIAITTTIKNLDVVHVGLATFQGERLHLLHASSKQKEVIVSSVPLTEYLAKNKIQSGIIIARLNEIE